MKDEVEAVIQDWRIQIKEAAAWCADHSIPVVVGPDMVAKLVTLADLLHGAVLGAGIENVPDGLLLYEECVRECARSITTVAVATEVLALAREEARQQREREKKAQEAAGKDATAKKAAGKKTRRSGQ